MSDVIRDWFDRNTPEQAPTPYGDRVVWLIEQIDEDERLAREVALIPAHRRRGARGHQPGRTYVGPSLAWSALFEAFDHNRVLAECHVKRRLLNLADQMDRQAQEEHRRAELSMPESIGDTRAREIRETVALSYAHRSGYRDEWKPA